jgi:hypothetical protein
MRALKGFGLMWLVSTMLFLGQNAAGVLHEYGIVAAGLVSGDKVLKIQPWHFLGLPDTYVTDLATSGAIITVLTPVGRGNSRP